jgi:hypothetical protein
MPGLHSKKEKRQAKHIVAGYKKKGASDKKAKSIAWATVNKLKNESWQFNGAGEPVFIGRQDVSQFDPSGRVSPGQSYLPDEVAKQFIKESGLRKMDTVPKRVIVNYLETMGLSGGLATDVARVLRDVYGVTPTFDEETLYGRSGALIEELTQAVSESFPMPFIDDSEPRELTEVDVIGSFLQREIVESTNEDYDTVLAHLAMLPPSQFMECVEFYEAVGPEVFSYFENLIANGHDDIAEHVLNGICFPNVIKFMPEHVQDLFGEDAADDVIRDFKSKRALPKLPKIPPVPKGGPAKAASSKPAAPKKPGMEIPKIKKQPSVPSARVQMRKHGKDLASDPLAAKKTGGALATFQKQKAAKEKADADANARGFKAQRDAEREKAASEKPSEPAKSPGLLKRAGRAALGAMKKVHSSFKDQDSKVRKGLSAVANMGKAVAKGAGKAVVGTAGAAAGVGGHIVGKAAGAAFRAATGAKKDDEPKEKKGIIGHVGHAIGRFAHHVKKGFRDANPGMAHVADKAKDEPAKEAEPKKERVKESPVGESLIGELTMMLSEGSYPDMGEKPYGPAGDPKKGPELAKKYLEPAGVETRMFSDPDKRDKARKAKLDDVMAAINGMKKAAAEKGVPPEGMFLNLYRDMHREKVRYS